MRTTIGYMLLALIVPYAFYAYYQPQASGFGMGIAALAVGGGIFLRRGREDLRRKRRSESPIPPDPRLPTFPPSAPPKEPDATEPKALPPPAPAEEPWKERDVIIPPAPDKCAARPVLRLVWTDGRRADVRDFRRKAAK